MSKVKPSEKQKTVRIRSTEINGVTLIKGNPSINDTALIKVFTGKKIDAKTLSSTWKR